MSNDIQIDGLTLEQVKMLDKMWAMESHEEFTAWFDKLPEYKQKMAKLLQELIVLEMDEADNPYPDTTQVNNFLKKFML